MKIVEKPPEDFFGNAARALEEALADHDPTRHLPSREALERAELLAEEVGRRVQRRVTKAQIVAQAVRPMVEKMIAQGCTWLDVGVWLKANPDIKVGLTTLRELIGPKHDIKPPKTKRGKKPKTVSKP